ncbi:hypothetical protein IFM89_015647 [Coptis chinensis]|uniref:Trichome birefringence-like C-terminal domain-containing protein n=1 Tax=Coptis chinensis TaxID=261450 RepID=A0A835IYD9_9MAGN|nr:hypothetical protein IFM89_015647 [Coptis chinensis]
MVNNELQLHIGISWSPFLVELDETNKAGRCLKLDTLPPSAKKWQGADIMVFNTGHWWAHTGKYQSWDFFQHDGKLVKNLELEKAFKMAMKTWSNWIHGNVDPAKTTVFFRSVSPKHKGKQWSYNETQPIQDEAYIPFFPTNTQYL